LYDRLQRDFSIKKKRRRDEREGLYCSLKIKNFFACTRNGMKATGKTAAALPI